MNADTIAALATPPGRAAIAIIRISGPLALTVADTLFRPSRGAPLSLRLSHTATHGRIIHNSELIDDALALLMRAPHSYTGEDVVEFHCHGNPLIVDRVLSALSTLGVRMAQPGEFTRRAFLNGRIDLTQAEAVADLISASADGARRAALAQLAGALSTRLRPVHDQLISLLAVCEACLEFPEDIEDQHLHAQQIAQQLPALVRDLDELLRTATLGRILHDGYRVVIAGKPNAGKSSLLNALAREERALVTPIPGTTRDVLEVDLAIEGFPVRFLDTAGIRAARGRIEQHGIARTRAALASADLILWVADQATSLPLAALPLVQELAPPDRSLWLWNKSDRPSRVGPTARARVTSLWHTLSISALTGAGLDTLVTTIAGKLRSLYTTPTDAPILLRARHRDLLTRAVSALRHAQTTLASSGVSELLSEDLRAALNALAELTGTVSTDDLLDRIFADFCIGK